MIKKMYQSTILEIAICYVETNGTVRKVGKELGIPKSSVHNNLVKFINSPHKSEYEKRLASKAKKILEKNKQESTERGGIATKQKYMQIKKARENN